MVWLCLTCILLLDIDECVEEPEICALGTCSNTEGSFKCLCPDGFSLSSTGRRCQGKCLWRPWAFITLCLFVVVLFLKHGKALILCEREDGEFLFTQRSNDYHMSESSFLLSRLNTHPSSYGCLCNNCPGTETQTPLRTQMLVGLWVGSANSHWMWQSLASSAISHTVSGPEEVT